MDFAKQSVICQAWGSVLSIDNSCPASHAVFVARKLRVQYPGAVYHLMSRGDHREDIFRDDDDRRLFLKTVGEACAKTGWQIHAYCLMRNHFHLVVETPEPNLVAGMKWLLGTYTVRFNRRHRLSGHLFSGRYKSLVVDGSGNGYLKTVCDYVHLNPVRARLLRPGQALTDFHWSSYGSYLTEPGKRWPWLRVDRLFGEHGIQRDSVAGRLEFEKRMELRKLQEENGPGAKMPAWCLGSEDFRKELLAQMVNLDGAGRFGVEIREVAEQKAERVLAEELRILGWNESELSRRRKGDPGKVRIAKRLRRETTMTLEWIAQRLLMGTKTHLTHLLYWEQREGVGAKLEGKGVVNTRD